MRYRAPRTTTSSCIRSRSTPITQRPTRLPVGPGSDPDDAGLDSKTTSTAWTPLGTLARRQPGVRGQSAANDGFSTKLVGGHRSTASAYAPSATTRWRRSGPYSTRTATATPSSSPATRTNGDPCSPSCSSEQLPRRGRLPRRRSPASPSRTRRCSRGTRSPASRATSSWSAPTRRSPAASWTTRSRRSPPTRRAHPRATRSTPTTTTAVLAGAALGRRSNGSTANGVRRAGRARDVPQADRGPARPGPAGGGDVDRPPDLPVDVGVRGPGLPHPGLDPIPGFGPAHIVEDVGTISGGTYPTSYTSLTNAYPQGNYWWRVQAYRPGDHGLAWSTPTSSCRPTTSRRSTTVDEPDPGFR